MCLLEYSGIIINILHFQGGYSALYWSAKDNSRDLAELLVSHGADVNIKDKVSIPPIFKHLIWPFDHHDNILILWHLVRVMCEFSYVLRSHRKLLSMWFIRHRMEELLCTLLRNITAEMLQSYWWIMELVPILKTMWTLFYFNMRYHRIIWLVYDMISGRSSYGCWCAYSIRVIWYCYRTHTYVIGRRNPPSLCSNEE